MPFANVLWNGDKGPESGKREVLGNGTYGSVVMEGDEWVHLEPV